MSYYVTSDGVLVHINRPRGHYIGQLRREGHRLWDTVTKPRSSPHRALAAAVLKGKNYKRARVLFIDHSGYYDPSVVMEATLA